MIFYNLSLKSNEKLIKMLNGSIHEASDVKTKDDALKYIGEFIPTIKYMINNNQKFDFNEVVYKKITQMLLPHIEDSDIRKGYFLGYMVNKLLKTYIGILPYSNRDSFLNKKVESSGELLGQLLCIK